jgi:DNA replication protein DnaC
MWAKLAEQADKEGWPAARFLAALAEHEIADRGRRRIERHLAEARLPVGKALENFEFEAVPMVSKAQIMALTAGDGWLEKGANLLLFGPPGVGKSHLAAAIGFALVENGWRELFMRTSDLVQRLQIARRELALRKRTRQTRQVSPLGPRGHRLCQQGSSRNQRTVRVHRKSIRATLHVDHANQPFGDWGKIFPDQAMTLAAIDRLVHHSIIFEMNVASYRRRAASIASAVVADHRPTRQSRRRADCRSATIKNAAEQKMLADHQASRHHASATDRRPQTLIAAAVLIQIVGVLQRPAERRKK